MAETTQGTNPYLGLLNTLNNGLSKAVDTVIERQSLAKDQRFIVLSSEGNQVPQTTKLADTQTAREVVNVPTPAIAPPVSEERKPDMSNRNLIYVGLGLSVLGIIVGVWRAKKGR